MNIKRYAYILIAVVIILTGCSQTTSSDGGFSAFKKEFDKRTTAQQAEYFKTLKGTEVTWSGEVYDAFIAEPNKDRHIVVHMGKAAEFASFTLNTSDKTDISKLSKGDAITIKGSLTEQGGLIGSWILTNATVVK